MSSRNYSSGMAWGGVCFAFALLLPGRSDAAGAGVAVQRLTELLPLAEISSPPLEGAMQLDPTTLPQHSLARLTTRELQQRGPAWTSGCVLQGGGRHRGLTATDQPCLLVTPVSPSRFLGLRRSIYARAAAEDLRIVELTGELADSVAKRPSRAALAALATKLRGLPTATRFPAPPLAEWRTDQLVHLSGPATRALAILLEAGSSAWIDGLEITTWHADGDAALRLLTEAEARSGHPLRLGQTTARAETQPKAPDELVRQSAILAPAPTDLIFDLQLPDEPRLSTTVGLVPMAGDPDQARFAIAIATTDGDSQTLYEGRLAGFETRHLALDLRRWRGRRVRLQLSVRAPADHRGWLTWGAPLIDGRAAAKERNLVLVTVDRLAADQLSTLGYGRPTTPHLDRLASEGILFEHMIAAHTADHHSIRVLLAEDGASLAGQLAEHGFTTHAIAGEHSLAANALHGYDTVHLIAGAQHTAVERIERALALFAAHPNRRLFVHVHLEDTTPPFAVPSSLAERFLHPSQIDRFGLFGLVHLASNGTPIDCPTCKRRDRSAAHAAVRDLEDAELSLVDQQVQRLLDTCATQDPPPLVAVVGCRGRTPANTGARLGDRPTGLSDAESRVPLLILDPQAPATIRGKRVKTLASTIDLTPTLLDLLGLPFVAAHGQSLRPHLLTRAATRGDRTHVVSRGVAPQVIAVRTAKLKYLLDLQSGQEGLFDLDADPHERLDLARRRPAIVTPLRLLALEHVIATEPGRYLAIAGDQRDRRYEVHLTTSDTPLAATRLHGLPRGGERRPGIGFAGRGDGGLVLLARLEVAAEAEINIELFVTGPHGRREKIQAPPERFVRAAPAELTHLAGSGHLAWRFFAGPQQPPPTVAVSVGQIR